MILLINFKNIIHSYTIEKKFSCLLYDMSAGEDK